MNRLPRGSSARAASCMAILATSFMTSPAFAGDKAQDKVACAASYEQSQRLRQAGKLRASHEELLTCSRSECPKLLRQDCVTWLAEVEAATPSVVFAARRSSGEAEADVRVLVDGTVVAERLTGPVEIDPGDHRVVFEATNAAPVERRLTLREGERGRLVEVTLPPLVPVLAPVPETEAATPPPEPPGFLPPPAPLPVRAERPIPSAFYVLGGTGIVAGAVGTYFEVSGLVKRSDLQGCQPGCAPGNVDSARTTLWVGNIALGVGVLALAGAVIVYLTRDERIDVSRGIAGVF